MSLSTIEKKVDTLSISVKAIEIAIVGDLKKNKPGLQDRVRDIEKQLRLAFWLSGSVLVGIICLATCSSLETLVKIITKSL